jgi:hypothetical protein
VHDRSDGSPAGALHAPENEASCLDWRHFEPLSSYARAALAVAGQPLSALIFLYLFRPAVSAALAFASLFIISIYRSMRLVSPCRVHTYYSFE